MPVRLKLMIIILLVLLSGWIIYPPREKINLGLDLKGGIDLTYEIDVPKLKSLTLENRAEVIKSQLDKDKVLGVKMVSDDSSVTFTITDTTPENLKAAEVQFTSDDQFKFFKHQR